MFKPFKRIYTPVEEMNRLQDAIAESFKSLADGALANSVLVTSVTLSTTTSMVEHTLGRAIQGFIIVRKNANADVWEDTVSANPAPTRLAMLRSSAAVTVSLAFF